MGQPQLDHDDVRPRRLPAPERQHACGAAEPLALPITLATAEIIDRVPVHGGMINGNTKIGFDGQGRVVVTYHKFDSRGFTQIINARRERGGWKIYQTSDWDYRWDFSGGGSIPFEIR